MILEISLIIMFNPTIIRVRNIEMLLLFYDNSVYSLVQMQHGLSSVLLSTCIFVFVWTRSK